MLRQGSDAWLVSSTARVLRRLERPYPRLPRIWVPRSADIAVNSTLDGLGAQGVAALAPLRPLRVGADVRQVRTGDGELTLLLGSGTEIRLGDSGDLRLKLAIAKQLLPRDGRGALPRHQRPRAAGRQFQPSSRRLRFRVSPCKSH